jgi:hypothetical protein
MPFKNLHPLYTVWQSMISRCYRPSTKGYKDYGGRGIIVCDRWLQYGEGFRNFISDMGERPKGFSIDRIDNNKGYFPENCKWSSRSEQQRNRRCAVKIFIEGVEYFAVDLAKKSGMKQDTLINRAKQGLTYAEVMDKKRRVFKDGLALGGKVNGARQKAKTHCPKGHEYSEENTSVTPQGFRNCKTCKRETAAAWRAKK